MLQTHILPLAARALVTNQNTCGLITDVDFEFLDINKDGLLEVFGIGDIYDAEVETIRYDASQGYVLAQNNNKIALYKDLISLSTKEVKAIESIFIKGELHLLLMFVDQGLDILKLK